MTEHIGEIIDANFGKTPTTNSLEVMVYFRSAADREGLYSKIKALYGITKVMGDDYFRGINLIADYSSPRAYFIVNLTVRRYQFETMTNRLIDKYNEQLVYGQICCEDNEIFYKKKVSWTADATSINLKDIVFKAFDEVVSDQSILEEFLDEHLQNLRDGIKV